MTFDRDRGTPETETINFAVIAGTFVVDLDDLGSQGADGAVTLNGATLMAPRLDGEIGPRHLTTTLQLPSQNTLEVRLVGKPGSELRVAIWPLMPVTLDAVTLAPGSTLQIGGPGVPFDATITNHTNAMFTDVVVQAWVKQGTARRAGGGSVIYCQAAFGVLPPGTCIRTGNGIFASNAAIIAGSGILVPGNATAVIELRQSVGATTLVLDSNSVPIVLTSPAVATVEVNLTKSSLYPGETTTATATLRDAQGNVLIGRQLFWSTGNAIVATVDANGVVTGVAPGSTFIQATSEGISGQAIVTVTTPPFLPGEQQPNVVTSRATLAIQQTGLGQNLAQTFTPSADQWLGYLEIPVGCSSGVSLIVTLRQGLGGAVLRSVNVSNLPLTVTGNFVLIQLFDPAVVPNGIRILANTTYAFELAANVPPGVSGSCGLAMGPIGNSYARGAGYHWNSEISGQSWLPLPYDDDLAFRTLVR